MTDWRIVRDSARGTRFDYDIVSAPLDDTGGQACVYRGTHKASGVEIAMKKLRVGEDTENNVARMRREIKYGLALDHRNVTPVLDHGDDFTWFVMPLAVGSLGSRRDRLTGDDPRIVRLIEQVCGGLAVAHERGWVHRDIKPANILRFLGDSGKGFWAICDWGLGRGALGSTTAPGRTVIGRAYGTEGFAAPELSSNAHQATAAADIYSLGQLIGWLVLGTDPITHVPHIPPSGAWRTVVRDATRPRPEDRPQSTEEFLALVRNEIREPGEVAASEARRLAAEAPQSESALRRLLTLAENNPDDQEIYFDVLPRLPAELAANALTLSPPSVEAIAHAYAAHVDSDWGDRQYKYADVVIGFIVRLCRAAAKHDLLGVLDEALEAYFRWDDSWDQWGPQSDMQNFLRSIRGDNARAAAAALRRHPASAAHFKEIGRDSRIDSRIRSALTE